MIQLNSTQFDEWVAKQSWLFLPEPAARRFKTHAGVGARNYECKISEGSSIVGCNMSRLFLHDIEPPNFPGGLFWIVRTFPPDEDMALFARQIFLAGGLTNVDSSFGYFLLDKSDYETCFSLVALALMFGWNANFVANEQRFYLVMNDEPFPALVTDSVSPWFDEVAKNLEFKVTDLP